MNNRVISMGPTKIKSSTIVTGDLEFTPKTRKWKGKEVLKQAGLVNATSQEMAKTRNTSIQLKESHINYNFHQLKNKGEELQLIKLQ